MKINIKKIFNLDNRGQGLIEVFIAIYLFLVALLSIMNLVSYNIQVQNFNHNMLIASNLAREGVEIVRNIRDTNWLSSNPDTGNIEWDNSLIYNESENQEVAINGHFPENSFYILNGYMHGYDFEYIITPLGLSWEDCINDNFSNFGPNYQNYPGGFFCKVNILRSEINPEVSFYDIFDTDSSPENVIATSFYRMININEICADGNDEEILQGYNEHCSDSSLEKIGIQVISRAGWKNLGRVSTVTLEDRLYNWK